MYQIVFSDIDGTLLNDEHVITPLTNLAIKQLQKQEIPFVIVSARSPSGIYPILEENNFKCPIISYGGGLILDENRNIIFEQGFATELALKIIDFIENSNFDMSWCIYSYDRWLVKNRQDKRVQREERIVKAISEEANLETISKLPVIHKILCICNPEYIDEIEIKLNQFFYDCQIVRSSNILIEITNKDISKAEAIKKYCKIANININNTLAFGDQYNDLQMLKTVGCGIAMKNAPLEIQKEVKKVTDDNNHDGIYWALKELSLVK